MTPWTVPADDAPPSPELEPPLPPPEHPADIKETVKKTTVNHRSQTRRSAIKTSIDHYR
jgi:hypothetical protein